MPDTPAFAGVFEPVTAATTFEETVARLGTAIRLGVLAPGTRLPPERELAEQFGISRSTLRQALKTLTETGHLVALRGRTGGTFVADEPPSVAFPSVPGDYASWRDFFDMRLAIELGAVVLAAERATADHLARLEAHNAAMRRAADAWADYRREDAFFHLTIAEATGSARIVASMTGVQGELNELLAHAPHPPTAMEAATYQHAEIVAAVRARDAAKAVELMRLHTEGLSQIVSTLLPAD